MTSVADKVAEKQRKPKRSATSLESHSVTRLKGIGPALAEKLEKLCIRSVGDILFHLPFRYEDRSRITPIAQLRNGQRAVIEGEISHAAIQFGKRRSLVCTLGDASGKTQLRFFFFSGAQQKKLAPGTTVRCFGEVGLTRQGLGMVHPEVEFNPRTLDGDTALTAIYPSTEGLHQTRWRQMIVQAFTYLDPGAAEVSKRLDLLKPQEIPASLSRDEPLLEILRKLHFPATTTDVEELLDGNHPYQQRLAFEELVAYRLGFQQLKLSAPDRQAPALPAKNRLTAAFLQSLPFSLTGAQQRVLQDIRSDIEKTESMTRLVQGDVGSGKTVVAAIAALQCIENNFQAVFMAPTEILAEQHYQTFSNWFRNTDFAQSGMRVELLVSAMPAARKRDVLESIAAGEVALVIGTHAVIQESVEFFNLGLAIIDEQHRFGVEQRKALLEKRRDGLHVHQLIMTATPIPRTLAMTFYANMDYSVIDELPPGRTPVKTAVLSNRKRESVIERIRGAAKEGRQVYWVCTLVEESELLAAQAAETTFEELKAALPDITIDLVHGRLSADEKQSIMRRFKANETQLLVATTVIEVGVDVPNASLMVIDNAERLGLAQLHQLRGRVGRGQLESHCVLLYQSPLSKNGRARLDIMRQSNDGFVIAEEDLRIRGPGEVLGTQQSGALSMRIADLERDAVLLDQVMRCCEKIASDRERSEKLIARWCRGIGDYSGI